MRPSTQAALRLKQIAEFEALFPTTDEERNEDQIRDYRFKFYDERVQLENQQIVAMREIIRDYKYVIESHEEKTLKIKLAKHHQELARKDMIDAQNKKIKEFKKSHHMDEETHENTPEVINEDNTNINKGIHMETTTKTNMKRIAVLLNNDFNAERMNNPEMSLASGFKLLQYNGGNREDCDQFRKGFPITNLTEGKAEVGDFLLKGLGKTWLISLEDMGRILAVDLSPVKVLDAAEEAGLSLNRYLYSLENENVELINRNSEADFLATFLKSNSYASIKNVEIQSKMRENPWEITYILTMTTEGDNYLSHSDDRRVNPNRYSTKEVNRTIEGDTTTITYETFNGSLAYAYQQQQTNKGI